MSEPQPDNIPSFPSEESTDYFSAHLYIVVQMLVVVRVFVSDVKHGRRLLKRFAHLLTPLRSPQLRLFLHICSSMLLLQLRLSQSQTRMGPLLVLHQGSFPLRESIEAFVSDWFIL